jgi:hypothetical protein
VEATNIFLAVQNLHGHAEEFFEIYKQIGHASSERFAGPDLRVYWPGRLKEEEEEDL